MAGLRSLLCTCAFTFLDVASGFSLTVLHINDHHSHLAGEYMTLSRDKFGFSSDVRVYYGGYPRLVSAFAQLKTQAESGGRSVLKLHAGDAITGTSYFSLFKGKADAEMMAYVCYDAFTLGNHEFDDGDQTLANFLGFLGNYGSICPSPAVVSANVVPGATSPLKGKISKSFTATVGGEKIGVVGIDIKSKTMESSSPSHGTTLTDERTTAQAEIDKLKAAGVNKIILLTHVGYSLDQAWMAGLKGVDVVIGGDSHSMLGDSNTIAGGFNVQGAYPTLLTNGDGKKLCVVQAGSYTKAVGNLQIEFDANGDVTSCTGAPQFAYDNSNMVFRDTAGTALTTAERQTVANYLGGLGGQWMAAAKDVATQAKLQTYEDQVNTLTNARISTVPAAICFDRFPGQGAGSVCSADATKAHGGGACQLVAKAFLVITKTADIAIQQAGGCRTDIDAGDFTYNDAYTMLPFSNTLVTAELTGAQVKSLLEDALDFALDESGSTGAYPYASGLRFAVDASKSKGSRFSNVQVNSRLAGVWEAINDARTYTLVTTSYAVSGKDGYSTFTKASNKVDSFIEYAEGLVMYAKSVQTLVAPPVAEFSTQAYTNKDGEVFSTWKEDVDLLASGANLAGSWVLLVPCLLAATVVAGTSMATSRN